MPTRIAAIQMNSTATVADNLASAGDLLTQAADDGAQLAVLPENFAIMGARETDKLAVAEADGEGPIQDFVAATAQRLKLWIVAGTLPLVGPDAAHVRPASPVYNAEGNRVACYDKIHLFDVGVPGSDESYRESDTFAAGPTTPTVVETPWGKLGLSVCYDLRFPELYRAFADAGVDLITAPAAFTHTTGQAHWHLLTRTRAVENQALVIAPNQAGIHANDRRTYGHSLIVDAWGRVLAEAKGGAGEVVLADYDREQQRSVRRDFPTLAHRRL